MADSRLSEITYNTRRWAFKTGALVDSTHDIFSLGTSGRIRIWSLFGHVSTIIGAGVTTMKITLTDFSNQDICTAAVITSFAASTLVGITGVFTDALQGATFVRGAIPMMANPLHVRPVTGLTITTTIVGGTTGAIDWACEWEPLDVAAVLVAA